MSNSATRVPCFMLSYANYKKLPYYSFIIYRYIVDASLFMFILLQCIAFYNIRYRYCASINEMKNTSYYF